MSFDMNFTIGIAPSMTNIENDMRFIKSTLLYADTITLISPIAYIYFQLTDESDRKTEQSYIKLLQKVLPFCESFNPERIMELSPIIKNYSKVILSKNYKSMPYIYRAKNKKMLKQFGEGVTETVTNMLGEVNCTSLKKLVNEGKIKLYDFKNPINNSDDFITEFFNTLKYAITNQATFPLFDEESNNLINAAIKDNIITLNDNNEFNIKHSALTNNLLLALPSFEYATVDEIIDIRKELDKPLVRFRSKMLEYNKEIQSMPWDDTFKHESYMLYQQHIAPSILELDEMTKENKFIKNLSYNLLTDDSFIKGTGGLIISIVAAGAISSFMDAVSTDTAILSTGGTYAASKIAKTFKEYNEKQNEVKKKDMYFYYKAGNVLQNKQR